MAEMTRVIYKIGGHVSDQALAKLANILTTRTYEYTGKLGDALPGDATAEQLIDHVIGTDQYLTVQIHNLINASDQELEDILTSNDYMWLKQWEATPSFQAGTEAYSPKPWNSVDSHNEFGDHMPFADRAMVMEWLEMPEAKRYRSMVRWVRTHIDMPPLRRASAKLDLND